MRVARIALLALAVLVFFAVVAATGLALIDWITTPEKPPAERRLNR